MKIILKLFFLLCMVKSNAQERIKLNDVAMNIDYQNSKDLLCVVKSMNNSLEIEKKINNNLKGIYIRSINGNHVDLNNQDLTVNGIKLFQFQKDLKGNLEDYMILDCKIMYSVYEVNIQFLNKYLENKEKLTIKFIE